MEFLWTRHAGERQKKWEEKRGITREEVEQVLGNPEQVVSGHRNARVAQSRRGSGLLRVPFVEEEGQIVIITLYWTSKVDKYWRKPPDEGNL